MDLVMDTVSPVDEAVSAVTIRPIAKADLELEEAFVRGLSRTTGYRRLLSARKPSAEEVRRWTDIDPSIELALIATVDAGGRERQVVVARYVVEPATGEAEFAIVVSDEWQGKGLGRKLLAHLIDAARRRRLKRLVGTTLSENAAMLSLAREVGFKARREAGSAMIMTLSLDLANAR